jgi:hypothetical protein
LDSLAQHPGSRTPDSNGLDLQQHRKKRISAILVHDMDNVSWTLFPNYGSGFDPFFAATFTCLAAGIVIIGWGPKTLAHYRYTSVNQK